MDPISALIGGGMSLLSGILGGHSSSRAAEAATNANIAQQRWALGGGYLHALRQNAEAAGFNPLAVLGNTSAGSPVAVGSDAGSIEASAGANAGNILAQMKLHEDKSQALRDELLRAQIHQVEAETVGRQLLNSKLAVATQAGVKPNGSTARPYPATAVYVNDKGEKFTGVSQEFGQNNQGMAGAIPGLLLGLHLMGDTWDTGWSEAVKKLHDYSGSIRPDVLREFGQPYYP